MKLLSLVEDFFVGIAGEKGLIRSYQVWTLEATEKGVEMEVRILPFYLDKPLVIHLAGDLQQEGYFEWKVESHVLNNEVT
jgi:hypothetical protein